MIALSDSIILSSWLLSSIFVVCRCLREPGVKFAWSIPGEGKFDLKSSWVSNTTLFGAILGSPLKDLGPPSNLSNLNVLFLALGAVAVLIQLGTVRAVSGGHRFPVWAYLLTAIVALWAAAGQLFTLAAIISGAERKHLTLASECVFLVAVACALIALAVYAWKITGQHLDMAEPLPSAEARPRVAERPALELTSPLPSTEETARVAEKPAQWAVL